MLRVTSLIVTRPHLNGGLGVDRESDIEGDATLVISSRSGKGAPTGMGRRYGFQPWVIELASGRVGRVPALARWHLAEESFDCFVERVKEK